MTEDQLKVTAKMFSKGLIDVESLLSAVEQFVAASNNAKPLVIGSRVMTEPKAKLKICRSEKEKCKGG